MLYKYIQALNNFCTFKALCLYTLIQILAFSSNIEFRLREILPQFPSTCMHHKQPQIHTCVIVITLIDAT